jgi:predicted dehydrogenase
MVEQQNRRKFLKAGAVAWTAASQSRILGANDRINIAVVGLGGRGRAHVNEWVKAEGAKITALCDVNQASLERAQATVLKATNEQPKGYPDMRQVFEDKNVDAVSMPLPNHWHALATIWAVQAGKDVYIEKPACHNVWEGWKMVEAARKHKRMVQIGSQSRSTPHKMKAMQLLQEGVIGKLYSAHAICYKRRVTIGKTQNQSAPPAGVDWDKFLGPAPMRPFNENRFLYKWHWFWDTGNGDIGNQGVHEMDIARWGMNLAFPKAVYSGGGKFVYDDDQETPNTQIAMLDYGDAEIVFEVRGLITDPSGTLPMRGNCVGNHFYGADGILTVDDDGFQVYKGEKKEKVMDEKAPRGVSTTGLHMANFMKGIRSRNYKDLGADVEIGAISADLCHLANISYRVKRRLTWDDTKKQFIGDTEANKLLTRDYRKPYVVPDKV